MIETQKYIRKPLYVDAVRVTAANFDEIATWCQGEIQRDEVPAQGMQKKYIKVRVHHPKSPRQTKAFIGDWILYTERGYKVYTNKAFHASFDLDVQLPIDESPEYKAKVQELLERELGSEEESIEVVPATPENIAKAVRENEKARNAEGKRVLSVEEQQNMDQDEIRELIQSGEVVLAQDLAA